MDSAHRSRHAPGADVLCRFADGIENEVELHGHFAHRLHLFVAAVPEGRSRRGKLLARRR